MDSFPFTIGRTTSTDLQIESNRVSREHAVISRDGPNYRVRDLGSMNGTLLNGQRVEEAALVDGDILVIADVELTFVDQRPGSVRNAATEAMDRSGRLVDDRNASIEIIRASRRLNEALTHRCIESLFRPIASLETDGVLGYQALAEDEDLQLAPSPADRALLAVECRLTRRIRRLRRMVAAEQAARTSGRFQLFMSLHSSEIDTDRLTESIGHLRDVLADSHRLVIELPDGLVSDTPYAQTFRSGLREMGVGLMCDALAAASGIFQSDAPPDFLKLANSMMRRPRHRGERRRQIEHAVRTARRIGCDIIATGIQTEEEARICSELGCRFGQGDLFGQPKPIAALCDRDDATYAIECKDAFHSANHLVL